MGDTDQNPVDAVLDAIVHLPVGMFLDSKDRLPELTEKGRQYVASQVGLARMIGQFAVSIGGKELSKRLGGLIAGLLSPVSPGSAASPGGGDGDRHKVSNGSAAVATPPVATPPVAGTTRGSPAAGAKRGTTAKAATTTARRGGASAKGLSAASAKATRASASTKGSPTTSAKATRASASTKRPSTASAGAARASASTKRSSSATDATRAGVPAGGNPPGTTALAIERYDTLAASQVIARLDGLGVDELEDVRSYELAHRNRKTILGRISQLQRG